MSFFLYDKPLRSGLTFPFSGEEAHHLLRSRRIRPGERFALQDPGGNRFEAEVVSVERRLATVTIHGTIPAPPSPSVRVTLLQGAVKDKAAEWIVQKCTELGAETLIFFPCEHGAVAHKALHAPGALARWERIAWEACKQSGRQFPPQIARGESLEALLAEHPAGGEKGPPGLLLHPSGEISLGDALSNLPGRASDPPRKVKFRKVEIHQVQIIVGPEGGLAPAEVAAARQAGYLAVQAGGNILRAETAAVAACALAVLG